MRPHINIYSKENFSAMHRAGKLAAMTLDFITPKVKIGCNTAEIDRLCEKYIREK